ncbi:serine/threonine protein kinase [Myxococcota bacterium]|nr:serine/threonine protein kinase [Myxococcota bacterium]
MKLETGARFCGACGSQLDSAGASGVQVSSPGGTVHRSQITPDTLSRAPMTLIGHMVGEYRVTHFVGKGGMGWVFAAVHPIIGKKVAIKVLKTTFSHELEVANAFVNEAKAANAIGSKKIVDIFAFGQLPAGNLYFVMELLEGESMAQYLFREGRLSFADARIIFPLMLEALSAAHAHGIVHRDLKPENIFLITHKGNPVDLRLLDFGIAKFNAEQPSFLRTQAGIIKGTPLYMSPEQC